MEPGTQHAGVEAEHGIPGERLDDRAPRGVPPPRLGELPDQLGIGAPVDVLGWVEGGEAPYCSVSFNFSYTPGPSASASAKPNSSVVA